MERSDRHLPSRSTGRRHVSRGAQWTASADPGRPLYESWRWENRGRHAFPGRDRQTLPDSIFYLQHHTMLTELLTEKQGADSSEKALKKGWCSAGSGSTSAFLLLHVVFILQYSIFNIRVQLISMYNIEELLYYSSRPVPDANCKRSSSAMRILLSIPNCRLQLFLELLALEILTESGYIRCAQYLRLQGSK